MALTWAIRKLPLSRAANPFDINLFRRTARGFDRIAEISFWTGDSSLWPDDAYVARQGGDMALSVNTSYESFAGTVDILRNESNRYFFWEDPVDRRAVAAIRTDLEPTGEGE